MEQVIFISNKTKKEILKYIFVLIAAVITWIFQLAVFSKFLYFDTTINLMLLGAIYFALSYGVLMGTFFGITASFLTSSILYDHVFYFSYPLIGIFAGLLTKKLFSDELLFFIVLAFLLTMPVEFLNGWQYSFHNPINITNRFILVCLAGTFLNLFFSPFYYWFMRFVTKKLNVRQN